ncbi:hypothetical protein AKO1_007721 [Acrasis kona]|uniref:Phytochrome chromophore attachment site domain-containing protein n=1 Tax=Acrasis kona TaxID=1008807 RepID=A0AAW2YRV1_9EUKA
MLRNDGRMQPSGLLIALSGTSYSIVHVSDNLSSFFNMSVDELLFTKLADISNEQDVNIMQSRIAQDYDFKGPLYFTFRVKGKLYNFEGELHRTEELMILELLPFDNNSKLDNFDEALTNYVESDQVYKVEDILKEAVSQAHKITDYEKVELYRMISSTTAELFALSYPSDTQEVGSVYSMEDIMLQNTGQYKSEPQLLYDVNYKPAHIIPKYEMKTHQTIDPVLLRDVSPNRLELLRSAGSKACLLIPITCKDELWGAIACHNSKPKQLFYEVRHSCEVLGKNLSELISRRISQKESRQFDVQSDRLGTFIKEISHTDNWIEHCLNHTETLIDAMNATGAVVYFNNQQILLGTTPSSEEISEIRKRIKHQLAANDVYITKGEKGPSASMLAMSFYKYKDDMIIWFRSSDYISDMDSCGQWNYVDVQVCRTFKQSLLVEILKQTIRSKKAEKLMKGLIC